MTIPLFKPYFSNSCRQHIFSDLDRILASGQLMLGEFKDKFENLFAQTVGVPYAISVNSCTTALTICLKYFDVEGYEILVPSGSFVTSVSSILFAGGIPVLVDMNPETLSFDWYDLERKITPRTKGIIWVHLTGFVSPESKEILKLAKDKKLFIIEDAAQALGATVDRLKAGSLGDAGCFSFYPTKIISCGSGGMITTSDNGLKKYAEQIRLFGKDTKTGEVLHLGNDWFLDEIRACVGYHHLKELKSNLDRRREIANRYRQALSSHPALTLLKVPENNGPGYYQFVIFLERSINCQKLIDTMRAKYHIHAKKIYLPCHKEKVFRKFDNGRLRKTEDTLNSSLCLPMYIQLTDNEISYITNSLIQELNSGT